MRQGNILRNIRVQWAIGFQILLEFVDRAVRHDSFVVPRRKDDFLRRTMNEAIVNLTNQSLPNIDRKALGIHEINSLNKVMKFINRIAKKVWRFLTKKLRLENGAKECIV